MSLADITRLIFGTLLKGRLKERLLPHFSGEATELGGREGGLGLEARCLNPFSLALNSVASSVTLGAFLYFLLGVWDGQSPVSHVV